MTPEQILESLKAQLRGNIIGYTKALREIELRTVKLTTLARKDESENILESIEKMEQIEVE